MVYYSVLFPAVFHGFLSSFLRHRMPAFLCSVPLPVSRPLFLFCRMLSGLFVCLFPGIGCRCSSPLWRGKVLPFTVQSRDHLATITDIYVPSFPYVHSPAFNAGFLRRSSRRLMSSGFLGLTSRPADQFLIIISHTRVGVYSLRKQLVIWSSGLPSTFYIAVCVDLFHASFAYQPSARTHGIYLVEGDESVLGDTESFVFVEGGTVRHLTAVGTQLGRQKVFQPRGLY